MVYLAYATIAFGLIHNVVTFYFARQYDGSVPFYRAWRAYLKGDLLSDGRQIFLWPTVTMVAFVGTALTLIISIVKAGAH